MIIGDIGCKCPNCHKRFSLWGRDSWLQGGVPVAYVKSDAENNLTIYGYREDDHFITFDPGSRFECLECEKTWDTGKELAAAVVRAELEQMEPYLVAATQ